MKKILVLLLAILMVFAIVSCKEPEPEQAEQPQATEGQGKDNLVSQGAKSGSKAIDNKGFKIFGSFDISGTKTVIEVGGKDGIYWIGTDEDDDEEHEIETYLLLSEVKSGDTVTLKVWNGSAWDSYGVSDSVLEALFGDGGLVDQLLFCSFGIEDNILIPALFDVSSLSKVGSENMNERNCTKYSATCTYDLSGVPGGKKDMKIAEINIYVDKEFAFTVAMDYAFADEFKTFASSYSLDLDSFKLSYNATVDLAPAGSALPAAYTAAAAAL